MAWMLTNEHTQFFSKFGFRSQSSTGIYSTGVPYFLLIFLAPCKFRQSRAGKNSDESVLNLTQIGWRMGHFWDERVHVYEPLE